MIIFKAAAVLLTLGFLDASQCSTGNDADQTQSQNQETMQEQAVAQVGLPNIVNFREMRTLKLVEELADQSVPTYAYLYNPFHNCFQYLGPAFGYPIPYATQYTNPGKVKYAGETGIAVLPQADPNGLFKPPSAAGTWVLMRDPTDGQLKPQYIEDNVENFTFRMPNECGKSAE